MMSHTTNTTWLLLYCCGFPSMNVIIIHAINQCHIYIVYSSINTFVQDIRKCNFSKPIWFYLNL